MDTRESPEKFIFYLFILKYREHVAKSYTFIIFSSGDPQGIEFLIIIFQFLPGVAECQKSTNITVVVNL